MNSGPTSHDDIPGRITISPVKLRDLAERLDCRLEGDGDVEIRRVAGIQDAEPGDVTFLANPKYEKALRTTRASAVILKEDAPAAPCAMLRARDPYLAFARAVGLLPRSGVRRPVCTAWRRWPPTRSSARRSRSGRSWRSARVPASAIARSIYPNVTIGPGARIGSDCVIHSNVSIRER